MKNHNAYYAFSVIEKVINYELVTSLKLKLRNTKEFIYPINQLCYKAHPPLDYWMEWINKIIILGKMKERR